jgi:phosphoribosylaminoimidazole-succinocarboxamide synthase
MIDATRLKPFLRYTLADAALIELPNHYRGKVRENYDLADGTRILIASTRPPEGISAAGSG